MSHDHTEDGHAEHHGYGVYIVTWLALLAMTALTVAVAGLHVRGFSAFVAVAIASVKAGVVMFFFMHLKDETPVFRVMVFVCLATFGIFIGLTFIDILYR